MICCAARRRAFHRRRSRRSLLLTGFTPRGSVDAWALRSTCIQPPLTARRLRRVLRRVAFAVARIQESRRGASFISTRSRSATGLLLPCVRVVSERPSHASDFPFQEEENHGTDGRRSRKRQLRFRRATPLKISITALVAIEHNDFARLPGGVFRRAYVRAFAAEVGLNADELAREYRARFETESPAGPLLRHEPAWKHRLRLSRRFPAGLVTIVGISICGSLILERGQVRDEASDGRLLSALKADPPDNTAQTDDSGGEEVGFANAAVADIRAPSLRLEIRTKGSCWISAVADGERVIYRLMQSGSRLRRKLTFTTHRPLFRRLGRTRQIVCRVHQRNMRERLRKIAHQAPRPCVVFLREQADIVAQSEQSLEKASASALNLTTERRNIRLRNRRLADRPAYRRRNCEECGVLAPAHAEGSAGWPTSGRASILSAPKLPRSTGCHAPRAAGYRAVPSEGDECRARSAHAAALVAASHPNDRPDLGAKEPIAATVRNSLGWRRETWRCVTQSSHCSS